MTETYTERVTFTIKASTYQKLVMAAAAAGYLHPHGYARAIVEEHLGVVDFNPLSATRQTLYTKQEGTIMGALIEKPKTITEICKQTGKWFSALQIVAKGMLAKGWIVEVDTKYTGGRPAKIYQLTEAGKVRLDQEAARLEKLAAQAEAARQEQARQSAKANPEMRRARHLSVHADQRATPVGIYTQALFDYLYEATDRDRAPRYTDKQIEEIATREVERADTLVRNNYSTWEAETAGVKSRRTHDPEGVDVL